MSDGGARRGPGRPAVLDVASVLAAAIDLIDDGGIDSCTMRALADRLGVTPMTIYRHVADKHDLLAKIPDAMLADVAADVRRRRRAIPALRAAAVGLGGVLDAHPAVAPLFHQPQVGPNMLGAANHCVVLLREEGCSEAEGFEMLRSVIALVVGQAVTSHGARDTLGVEVFLAGVRTRLVDPG